MTRILSTSILVFIGLCIAPALLLSGIIVGLIYIIFHLCLVWRERDNKKGGKVINIDEYDAQKDFV